MKSDQVRPIACLGQLPKGCCADDEDSLGAYPSFLTSGMCQLVDRIHQLRKRLSFLNEALLIRSSNTKQSFRDALAEILRGIASLPKSIAGQDSSTPRLRLLIELLELSVHALEEIQHKRREIQPRWDDLFQLFRDMVAWSAEWEFGPSPARWRLAPVVQCLIKISQGAIWIDFCWLPSNSMKDSVPVVEAGDWNVGLVMLAAIPSVAEQSGVSLEELTIAAPLCDMGILIGRNQIGGDHRIANFEAHIRSGEGLIHHWLPGTGLACEVALAHHEKMSDKGFSDFKVFPDIKRLQKSAGAAKCVAGCCCRRGVNGGPIALNHALELAKADLQSGAIDKASLFAIFPGSGSNSRAVA